MKNYTHWICFIVILLSLNYASAWSPGRGSSHSSTECIEFAGSASTAGSASSVLENKQVQFLDIPWGVDGATAKKMMTAREGVRFLPGDSDSTKLMFEGGAYLGKPVRLWNLMFDHDRFISGGVTFEPEYLDEVLPLYVECKKELTSEFGLPYGQKEEFDPTENTKARIKQLKEQANETKPRFQLSWRIPAPERRLPDGILLYIMKGSDVCISYVCSDLFYEASQRRRMAH